MQKLVISWAGSKKSRTKFIQINNLMAPRVIENSIYKNNKLFINGITFFVSFNKKTFNLVVKNIDTVNPQVRE